MYAELPANFIRFIQEWRQQLDDRIGACERAEITYTEVENLCKLKPDAKIMFDELMRLREIQVEDALFKIGKTGEAHTATREYLRANSARYKDTPKEDPEAKSAATRGKQRQTKWFGGIQKGKRAGKSKAN